MSCALGDYSMTLKPIDSRNLTKSFPVIAGSLCIDRNFYCFCADISFKVFLFNILQTQLNGFLYVFKGFIDCFSVRVTSFEQRTAYYKETIFIGLYNNRKGILFHQITSLFGDIITKTNNFSKIIRRRRK